MGWMITCLTAASTPAFCCWTSLKCTTFRPILHGPLTTWFRRHYGRCWRLWYWDCSVLFFLEKIKGGFSDAGNSTATDTTREPAAISIDRAAGNSYHRLYA